MKIVSLVPSWTETLIFCGAEVVGRTRFCIHPAEKVRNITVVGGTKDLSLEKLIELKPDLLILDKEENLSWMSEQSPCPVFVSHVTDVGVMPEELRKMSALMPPQITDAMLVLAQRWTDLLAEMNENKIADNSKIFHRVAPGAIPGLLEWVSTPQAFDKNTELVYVIWRKPWMCVSQNTFIGSVIKLLGGKIYRISGDKKYPEFSLESLLLDPDKNLFFLFSSEPYPFVNKKQELLPLVELGMCAAIVDGESYSWFGVRTLKFLEDLSSIKNK